MDRLINAILKLSREGRRVLLAEPVELTCLVETLRESVAHQLVERGATIEIGPLPRIVSDRLALEQILGNIVENAVKYLDPSRPGLVRVQAEDAGPLIRLAISDNGRGIAPGDFERIFDLFRRAGRQDVPGEGIGLAHTRALVRRLGGSIEVASTPGEGSTFTVTLPKVLDEAETTRTHEKESAA
ncbi:MAG: sensor histidine kinase [Salinarimonas sp.]